MEKNIPEPDPCALPLIPSSVVRPYMGFPYVTCLVLAIFVLAHGTPNLHAQAKPSEYKVKAAYLFNFAALVGWPPGAAFEGTPLRMCVLGKDPFGLVLDETLAGGMINGTSLSVARIYRPEEALTCHILYISSSEDSRLQAILETLAATAVLTVSDLPGFSERGGMIEFTLEQGKVRFEVNLAASAKANLTLSSDLLKLARRVITGSRRGVSL